MSTKSVKSGKSGKSVQSKKSNKSSKKSETAHDDGKSELEDMEAAATVLPPEIPDDMTEEEMEKMEREQKELIEANKAKLERLRQRQKLLDQREKLMEEQKQVELLIKKQKLQEREAQLRAEAETLELTRKEQELDRLQEKNEEEKKLLKSNGLPEEVEDNVARTADWVEKSQKPVGPRSVKAMSTNSQKIIADLEEQIRTLKMNNARGAPPTQPGADRLKQLGILPPHIDVTTGIPKQGRAPNQLEARKLQEDVHQTIQCTGNDTIPICCEHSQKAKQSGKFAKTNVNIKYQENWPHVNVLKKYCKRSTFDNLEFEAFVAGETRVILQMENRVEARGRLKFLSQIAHWMCASKDWNMVKSLYEGVVESIELGDEVWTSDFTHYENLITRATVKTEPKEVKDKVKKERGDIYWCKAFQKGNCSEKSPHMMTLKPEDEPVPVLHICAYCFQKDNSRKEHAEQDCTHKK